MRLPRWRFVYGLVPMMLGHLLLAAFGFYAWSIVLRRIPV